MGCIGPSIVVLQFGSLYKSSRYDIAVTLHNLQVPGRDFQSQFQMDKPSENCLHRHTRSRPHPTWETKLRLPVPLWDKKESNESSRQRFFFSSIIYHSASESKKKSQKKRICVGGKQTKDFGSEWKYVLMSLHVRIHFYLTCALLSTHLLSRSPFFPIFTSKHQKKYIKQHVPIHSLHLNSAPEG